MKKVCYLLFFILLDYISYAQIPFTLINNILVIPSSKISFNGFENSNLNFEDAPNISLEILYQTSQLGFDELSLKAISGSYLLSNSSKLITSAGYYGFDLMNEFNISIGYIHNFDKLSLGISTQMNSLRIKDYSEEKIIIGDLYGKVDLGDISIGFLLNNISQSHYANYSKTIYQRAIFSGSWEITEQIAIDLGSVVLINSQSTIFGNVTYKPSKFLGTSLQYIHNPQKIKFAVLLVPIDWLKLNLSFIYQPIFGTDSRIVNIISID